MIYNDKWIDLCPISYTRVTDNVLLFLLQHNVIDLEVARCQEYLQLSQMLGGRFILHEEGRDAS